MFIAFVTLQGDSLKGFLCPRKKLTPLCCSSVSAKRPAHKCFTSPGTSATPWLQSSSNGTSSSSHTSIYWQFLLQITQLPSTVVEENKNKKIRKWKINPKICFWERWWKAPTCEIDCWFWEENTKSSAEVGVSKHLVQFYLLLMWVSNQSMALMGTF